MKELEGWGGGGLRCDTEESVNRKSNGKNSRFGQAVIKGWSQLSTLPMRLPRIMLPRKKDLSTSSASSIRDFLFVLLFLGCLFANIFFLQFSSVCVFHSADFCVTSDVLQSH
jgi:hypothetical protein